MSCLGVGTGSGFALDDKTLLTNRHVLAGASRLEVSTWDGHSLEVSAAEVGSPVDLGTRACQEADPADVKPGSSGSPVLDRRGRVVGIVHAIERATGLGPAIPCRR